MVGLDVESESNKIIRHTTTIPTHQSVGSLTLVITPCSSIRESSSLTAGMRGIGTLRGVEIAYGRASS